MLCCQLEAMKPMVELYVTQNDQAMYGDYSSWTSYGAWRFDGAAIHNRMSTNGSIVLIYTLIHCTCVISTDLSRT